MIWKYWQTPKEEAKAPEIKTREETIISDAEKYLHKNAFLSGARPSEVEYHEISLEEARLILFAVQHLENKGVKNIKICETEWIVAPLEGYLINGKGDFRIGDKHYSTFRIGVKNGTEGGAGGEFMFIARGEDDKGNVLWYPEPGPDYEFAEEEVFPEELWVYEFL